MAGAARATHDRFDVGPAGSHDRIGLCCGTGIGADVTGVCQGRQDTRIRACKSRVQRHRMTGVWSCRAGRAFELVRLTRLIDRAPGLAFVRRDARDAHDRDERGHQRPVTLHSGRCASRTRTLMDSFPHCVDLLVAV